MIDLDDYQFALKLQEELNGSVEYVDLDYELAKQLQDKYNRGIVISDSEEENGGVSAFTAYRSNIGNHSSTDSPEINATSMLSKIKKIDPAQFVPDCSVSLANSQGITVNSGFFF